jgi:hypothetical protein
MVIVMHLILVRFDLFTDYNAAKIGSFNPESEEFKEYNTTSASSIPGVLDEQMKLQLILLQPRTPHA